MEKKLFLLDAYALIYRAYYALLRSPRMTSGGMNTSAIFGFLNTLEDLLRKENPGYMAVCFDPAHGRTFRHEQYAEYKAGRDKQPEDITAAIPYIKDILRAFRIEVIEVEGYEADDVIGTLSRKAEEAGFVTYMMTPDKDYGQLVTDRVMMYRPALKGQGFEVRGPQQVCERYGISSPRQVIDLLALEGDASDNVPGCPGVGEKTAVKLIEQFGSVENMLEHTDQIKGALQKKVVDNADLIRLSKELVTIATDAPVNFDAEALRRKEPDAEALVAIFRELEFNSYIKKYASATNGVAVPEPPKSRKPDAGPSLFDFAEQEPETAHAPIVEAAGWTAREISAKAEVAAFVASAAESPFVGMALNSVGAEAMTAACHGMALAFRREKESTDFEAAYIPFPADATLRRDLCVLLEPLFANEDVTIVGSDIKRDMLILRRMGVTFEGAKWYDTSVAHYLCQPEQKHDLPTLAMTYLGYTTYDYAMSAADRRMAPLDPVAAMCETASTVLRLRPLLEAELELKGQTALLRDVELPFVAVLASMEYEGARIDPSELHALSRQLSERLAALEAEAFAIAGRPFNVSSPAQVGQILFGEMKIDPKARKTKGGAWSTAEDVLEKYAAEVPLVKLILDIRGLRKLLATYVDALPKLVNPSTGKIHTTYNQTVTATGRISSTNPNLQNIPVRTDDGREIRRAFVPDPGCLMLSADYSQIELRLMADLSGDEAMIEAFLSGADIHRATAAKIYHEELAEVTETQRRNAKTANFGIIYGISAFGLSERLGIPRGEAKELIEGYLATYPGVAQYMKQAVETARRDGFVTTILGRKRYLPDINSRSNTVRSYAERNAINAPLQGSAADIIKVAMVNIFAEMTRRGMASRMIMQVHDELIFNVVPEELPELQELVVRGMVSAYNGRVPLEVAAGTGSNWLEAH
ncbi:MAG: DNA polymerase I [Muribaculaceae bacterium]|nr:DNA polymerase I [Muribaculaceae bacterium]